MGVALTLCDQSSEMVRAWRAFFPADTGVQIVQQNILALDADALALPANSFGFTDGGVDMAISKEVFDWQLQDRLRDLIEEHHSGELLVGQARVMETGSQKLRYVVVAPTMRVPSDVSGTVNAYLAMRAILLACDAHNRAARESPARRIGALAVPGLATGTGKMPYERAAYQMWMAYCTVVLGEREWVGTLERQVSYDRKLREK